MFDGFLPFLLAFSLVGVRFISTDRQTSVLHVGQHASPTIEGETRNSWPQLVQVWCFPSGIRDDVYIVTRSAFPSRLGTPNAG